LPGIGNGIAKLFAIFKPGKYFVWPDTFPAHYGVFQIPVGSRAFREAEETSMSPKKSQQAVKSGKVGAKFRQPISFERGKTGPSGISESFAATVSESPHPVQAARKNAGRLAVAPWEKCVHVGSPPICLALKLLYLPSPDYVRASAGFLNGRNKL
jgi:hypothetical protein